MPVKSETADPEEHTEYHCQPTRPRSAREPSGSFQQGNSDVISSHLPVAATSDENSEKPISESSGVRGLCGSGRGLLDRRVLGGGPGMNWTAL